VDTYLRYAQTINQLDLAAAGIAAAAPAPAQPPQIAGWQKTQVVITKAEPMPGGAAAGIPAAQLPIDRPQDGAKS